ncbi:hypothetical protein ACJD0Z_03435 [Flavobacteriaceae bacterium M23B6Z8]
MNKKIFKEFSKIVDFSQDRMNVQILDTYKELEYIDPDNYFTYRHATSDFHNTDFMICKYFYKPIHLTEKLILEKETDEAKYKSKV